MTFLQKLGMACSNSFSCVCAVNYWERACYQWFQGMYFVWQCIWFWWLSCTNLTIYCMYVCCRRKFKLGPVYGMGINDRVTCLGGNSYLKLWITWCNFSRITRRFEWIGMCKTNSLVDGIRLPCSAFVMYQPLL